MTQQNANSSSANALNEFSVRPSGEKFASLHEQDYAAEFQRLEKLASEARQKGKEIVVAIGVGFVGAVMAPIIADTEGDSGHPSKFVIHNPYVEHWYEL